MWHENLKCRDMRYARTIYFAACCLLLSLCGLSQAPSKFYTRFGGSGYDYGYDIKQTLDGGYIIVGSTSSFGHGNTDLYLVKLDSMGTKKWESAFGSYNNDIGKSVVQLPDSSYVMAGYTNSNGFGGYDMYLVKADKNGSLLWENTFGGTDWDFGYSLKATNDGGFILCGTTYSFGRGQADGYIIKTNASGALQWNRTYGGALDDEFKSVIQTSDGGYALAGYTKSYNDANGDAWIFKLNAAGDSVWCQFHGGPQQDYANDVIEHTTGEFYMAGATASFGSGQLDGYGLKLSSTGALIWHQEDGHPGSDEEFLNVLVPKTDNTHTIFLEKNNFPAFGIQAKVIELNSASYYYTATDYGSVDEDAFFKFVNTKDKGYACAGYTYGYNASVVDVYFLKMDSTLLGSTNYDITSVMDVPAQESGLRIYPTLCSNFVNLKFTTFPEKALDIKIFDAQGNEVKEARYQLQIVSPQLARVNFNLANGLYFIKINNVSGKIVVSN